MCEMIKGQYINKLVHNVMPHCSPVMAIRFSYVSISFNSPSKLFCFCESMIIVVCSSIFFIIAILRDERNL